MRLLNRLVKNSNTTLVKVKYSFIGNGSAALEFKYNTC